MWMYGIAVKNRRSNQKTSKKKQENNTEKNYTIKQIL